MACVSAPKKFMYQTPSTPMIAGMFFSSGVVRKCSSISWAPVSRSSKLSMPTEQAIESPIALQSE